MKKKYNKQNKKRKEAKYLWKKINRKTLTKIIIEKKAKLPRNVVLVPHEVPLEK